MQIRQLFAKFAAVAALSAFTLGAAHANSTAPADQPEASKPHAEGEHSSK
ncbi:hypothetical protein N8I74_04820 [Chitiniphilus purpureus]|uniref:Acid-shock protein n=1 Tax=Chitiniphilus purpureus TaxID=2981137 RepID=A0ABY6DPN6_9NEIS|nr:hypothetical protein [Chitiniphilus sp. CD1]UXY16345.1 hypothetical protein N8I74_04820 [Chitiniphilus sp. CD1]